MRLAVGSRKKLIASMRAGMKTLRLYGSRSQTIQMSIWASVKFRFPINPPLSKEEYVYRSIYSELFPSDSAAQCVPSVPSVACSTPIALEWDEAFKKNADPSGRAVSAVHEMGYK